eukprot:CAMPEP_0172422702 /NCGR_PEP_ID=MMETSP1064-20121228/8834_1 /TAXON_ID=202472 /ORGANISM="Aulacoseira subarctica , Strain CCAP 1002/5" /LENGTH=502 /DNA_ID=CAMNT_0013163693 /DNA_START=181 /DNA_END=1689 /DNA_ORIENTATION=-
MCCSDCPERQPRWASLIVPPPGSPPGSLPMGAFVCLECSGSHRRLGVHIAFVRSVNLDQWKEKEVIAMENGGNEKVNAIFEARLNGVEKPSATANGPARERFIRDKYERRKFFEGEVLNQYYNGVISSSSSSPAIADETNDKPKAAPGYFKIRTPSDAAKMRAESKRSHSPKKEVYQNGGTALPKKEATQNVGATAPSNDLFVADLLDFGSMTESAVPQFDVSAAMKQQQDENNFANFSGPFSIKTSNTENSVEVTVNREMCVNQSQPAFGLTNASVSQPKPKPAFSSDDIMKLFHQPPQQQPMQIGMPAASPFMMQQTPNMMGMAAPTLNNSNNTNTSMFMQQQDSSSISCTNGNGMTIQHQQQLMMQQQLFMMQQQNMSIMMKQMTMNSTASSAKSNAGFGVSSVGAAPPAGNIHSPAAPTWDNNNNMYMDSNSTTMGSMAPMGGTTNYSGGLNVSQLNIMNRLQMGNMSVGSVVPDEDNKELAQKQSHNQFGSLNLFNL